MIQKNSCFLEASPGVAALTVYACTDNDILDPLIRDRKFILRTDHKNLLYFAEDSNPMIVGWYMALKELELTIKHIAGSLNLVADWLSRLCKNSMINHPKEYDEDQIYISAIMDDAVIPFDFLSKIRICHNFTCGYHCVNRTISKRDEAFPK